jgi:hypothetical protein
MILKLASHASGGVPAAIAWDVLRVPIKVVAP